MTLPPLLGGPAKRSWQAVAEKDGAGARDGSTLRRTTLVYIRYGKAGRHKTTCQAHESTLHSPDYFAPFAALR